MTHPSPKNTSHQSPVPGQDRASRATVGWALLPILKPLASLQGVLKACATGSASALLKVTGTVALAKPVAHTTGRVSSAFQQIVDEFRCVRVSGARILVPSAASSSTSSFAPQKNTNQTPLGTQSHIQTGAVLNINNDRLPTVAFCHSTLVRITNSPSLDGFHKRLVTNDLRLPTVSEHCLPKHYLA